MVTLTAGQDVYLPSRRNPLINPARWERLPVAPVLFRIRGARAGHRAVVGTALVWACVVVPLAIFLNIGANRSMDPLVMAYGGAVWGVVIIDAIVVSSSMGMSTVEIASDGTIWINSKSTAISAATVMSVRVPWPGRPGRSRMALVTEEKEHIDLPGDEPELGYLLARHLGVPVIPYWAPLGFWRQHIESVASGFPPSLDGNHELTDSERFSLMVGGLEILRDYEWGAGLKVVMRPFLLVTAALSSIVLFTGPIPFLASVYLILIGVLFITAVAVIIQDTRCFRRIIPKWLDACVSDMLTEGSVSEAFTVACLWEERLNARFFARMQQRDVLRLMGEVAAKSGEPHQMATAGEIILDRCIARHTARQLALDLAETAIRLGKDDPSAGIRAASLADLARERRTGREVASPGYNSQHQE